MRAPFIAAPLLTALFIAPALASNTQATGPTTNTANTVTPEDQSGPTRHNPPGGEPQQPRRGHHRGEHPHHNNYGVMNPNTVYHGPHP